MTITPAALAAFASGDIANFMAAATPGGIERQEAEGQRQMASAFRTLPKQINRETAEAFGFIFGDDADDIFVNVTAPAGWSIRPTEHSMHSDIVDEQGRVRGSIFYKAAFYDRSANGHWSTRYAVRNVYDGEYNPTAVNAVDTATGEILFSQAVEQTDEPRYKWADGAEAAANAYLDEHFPNRKSATAYWTADTDTLGDEPGSAAGRPLSLGRRTSDWADER